MRIASVIAPRKIKTMIKTVIQTTAIATTLVLLVINAHTLVARDVSTPPLNSHLASGPFCETCVAGTSGASPLVVVSVTILPSPAVVS